MVNVKHALTVIFTILGIVHLQIMVHEIVHMIDGWTPNVAVCYSFVDLDRLGFVINGDNYTLYNGEVLAYGINILIGIVLYRILLADTEKEEADEHES